MRAERHPGIDELLHVAIDEHDVAALAHGQRGLGLGLDSAKSPWRSDGEAANPCSLSISPMISRSTPADKLRASLISCSRTWSSCALGMRIPAYAPNSRSGATFAHPSMTSRCHSGRGWRSAGTGPIRKMIPAATQSRPTVAGSVGELTDTEP